MSAAATLFYIRETNHILAALTRNATDSGEMEEAELRRVIPDGLVLRTLAETSLRKNGAVVTSRATTVFKIDLRHIAVAAAAVDSVDETTYLSRPTEFSLIDGKPSKTPPSFDGFASLEVTVQSSGVKLVVAPTAATAISKEISVWCLIKTTEDRILIQTAKIPKNANLGVPSSVTVPFTAIPIGSDHDFLIMIEGFLPIWDLLRVSDTRTWTP